MSSSDDRRDQPNVSRRTFLKGTGVAGVAGVALTIPTVPSAEAREITGIPAATVIGPEKGKITLTVNGAARVVEAEPRVFHQPRESRSSTTFYRFDNLAQIT